MTDIDYVILVISRTLEEAENLKELIEFMDTPNVLTAPPDEWSNSFGDKRLEGVFVGPDLSSDEVDTLLDDIGKFDANVPIVMLNKRDAA